MSPRWVVVSAGIVSTVAISLAGAAVLASLPWRTTYAAWAPALAVADASAALVVFLAGVLVWAVSPANPRGGLLLLLAAAAWAAADWVGWQAGPEILRSLGAIAAVALLPLVLHVVLFDASSPHTRRLVPWLYAACLMLGAARVAVTDPLADPDCWQNCTANPLLVADHPPLARAFGGALLALFAAIAVALGVAGARDLGRSRSRAARARLPLLLPAAVLAAGTAAQDALVLGGAGQPPDSSLTTVYTARAWAFAAVGIGSVLMVMPTLHRRRLARLLARDLAQSRDLSLATLLGRAIGDPTVTVSYRMDGPETWVDPEGAPVDRPSTRRGRGVLQLTRAHRIVAEVSHDPSVASTAELEESLGSAARLALENESLRAQLLSRLRELRESQRRIVEASDGERTRLERNLHDAAQVSVLALSAQVRRTLVSAQAAGDETAYRLLEPAPGQVQAAIDDLRQLAHGIHPANLDLGGLQPALETLADHAPMRVEVVVTASERHDPDVEHTTYTVAAQALREAARRGEDDLLVRVVEDKGSLLLTVEGTAQTPGQSIQDRVEAMGGQVAATEAGLEVRLSCVSS